MWQSVLSNYLGMTRTVLLRLKSWQLIANQIWEFCYSYDYNDKDNDNDNDNINNDNDNNKNNNDDDDDDDDNNNSLSYCSKRLGKVPTIVLSVIISHHAYHWLTGFQ